MNTLPTIGQRVKYAGSSVVGPCVGTVASIYPSHIPAPGEDDDDDDCRYVQGPFDPNHWHVAVEIDGELPTPFVYPDTNKFAALISEIEPA